MTDRRYIADIANSLISETDEEAIWIDHGRNKPKKGKKRSNLFDFTVGTGGIFICYLIYGILQETITGTKRGETGEQFQSATFLMTVQCISNTVFAAVLLRGKEWTSSVPQRDYITTAFSYLGGMAASYLALDYINFPTITLAKSCKMIPVMLTGSIMHGKKYSRVEYARMGLIAVGVTFFMLKRLDFYPTSELVSDISSSIDLSVLIGISLTVLSLAFDGYTGSTQDTFIAQHKPSTQQLMFYTNLWSVAILLVNSLFIQSSTMPYSIDFLARHPSVILELMLFCVVSCLGQIFVFFTVNHLGALTLSVITTTRKFFTILMSVLLFDHELKWHQQFGMLLVFAALGWEIYTRYNSKKDKKQHKIH